MVPLLIYLASLLSRQPVLGRSHSPERGVLNDQSYQSNIIDGGEFISRSKLMMTVPAGQPTSISPHHLSYLSPSLEPEQIVYRLLRPLGDGEGRLLLTDQPHKQILQFTQGDVDAMRVAYLPPDITDSEQVFSLRLAVTRAHTNTELVEQKTLKIKVLPVNRREPQFKIMNPKLQLYQTTYVNIPREYFEIEKIGPDDPSFTFVVTEMPKSGSLTFLFHNNTFMNLEGGTEFRLKDFNSGQVQYRYHGDRSQLEDGFEILSTDGNFEVVNRFSLEIIPRYPDPIKPVIQFEQQESSIKEDVIVFRARVLRAANTSVRSEVWCDSYDGTALAGSDFVLVNRSVVVFEPGVTAAECVVMLLDDELEEGTEEFILRLNKLVGDDNIMLGDRSALRVYILDVESKPTIEFDKRQITVADMDRQGMVVPIHVTRKGNSSHESRVQAASRDGTASKGVDYEELSQLLVFSPGVQVLPLRLRVVHRTDRNHPSTFYIDLLQEGLVGAELGDISTVLITVTDSEGMMKVLPSQPVVVSLLDYSNNSQSENSEFHPGYPLVCVSPCDKQHPLYNTTQRLCKKNKIKDVLYSWEVASPSTDPAFSEIIDSTIFTNVHSKVLDPSLFSRNFKVRCMVLPISNRGAKGVPSKSKAVKISGDVKPLCAREHPFVASLDYVNSTRYDVHHRNTIHIHIEIPHTDGRLPLISTLPLVNPRVLLLDNQHRFQHVCSNLYNTSAFYSDGAVVVREDQPAQLYRHLDLDTCLWTFDAWFHMSQLVDNCGGKIISEMQVRDSGQNYVTVRVPLYVLYLTARAPLGWTAVDHHTDLEVSFHYTSLLLHHTSVKTEANYSASIQVTRVGADAEGRLQIDFTTAASFRGHFVLRHHSLPGVESGVFPPPAVETNLTLQLTWSQRTWDGPHQAWRAVTHYSLQDYSGEYTVALVPCLARPGQPYNMECTPRASLTILKLPVVFQQSPRPAPLVYRLETLFTITNSKTEFLAQPDLLMDFPGEFSPGEVVYGRVMWNPSQHLHSAYSLTIQQLYLCVGSDDYIPVLDPTRQQFGCLQSSPQLRHSFLLLDREEPYAADKAFDNVEFRAYFAYELSELEQQQMYPGVDGFAIQVDPLYKINSGYQWYLQVLYSIGPKDPGRVKRSTSFTPLGQNGTDVKMLRLHRLTPYTSWPVTTVGLCAVVILGASITVMFWWFRGGTAPPPTHHNNMVIVRAVVPTLKNHLEEQDGTEV